MLVQLHQIATLCVYLTKCAKYKYLEIQDSGKMQIHKIGIFRHKYTFGSRCDMCHYDVIVYMASAIADPSLSLCVVGYHAEVW